MLTRIRSVATGAKVTVRLTRLLPDTVACVTQAAPSQVCTVKGGIAILGEGRGVCGLQKGYA